MPRSVDVFGTVDSCVDALNLMLMLIMMFMLMLIIMFMLVLIMNLMLMLMQVFD